MEHVAIMMTGGFRTMDKIFPNFVKNILSVNNYTLFILCEVNDPAQLYELLGRYPQLNIGTIVHSPSFRNEPQYQAIVNMIESSERPGLSQEVYKRAAEADKGYINWLEVGPGFIKSSGSILQYYQVWRLWQHVLAYERTKGVSFTHCMRTRCDIIFNEPVVIKDDFVEANTWYSTFQSQNRIDCNPSRYHHTTHELTSILTRKEDYVITFSVDLVWIARRPTFDKLSQIIFHYGLWDSGHPFSFNAETAFHEFCTNYNIHHYGITERDFPLYAHSLEQTQNHVMIILR